MFDGEFAGGERYFRGKKNSKRGPSAARKTLVFSLLRRAGWVYTKIITNIRSATLLPTIERKAIPDGIVY